MGNECGEFKVMLIEDDQTMVSLLTTLLNLEGFIVKAPANNHLDGYLNAILEATITVSSISASRPPSYLRSK